MADDRGPAPFACERIDLVWMPPALLEALGDGDRSRIDALAPYAVPAGWPDAPDAHWIRIRRGQMRDEPADAPWLGRAIVLRETNAMVGHIGFHGRPDGDGIVELGYTIFGPYRRRGFAQEAIAGMMRWAHETHGVGRFRISVGEQNEPSLALGAKLGFVRTGWQMDEEDGPEIIFERRWG